MTINTAELLQQFADQAAYVRGVVVASADGVRKAHHGVTTEGAERLAATASGLWMLARSAGTEFDRSDTVRQVAAELDTSTLFVVAAGSGSVLAVVADQSAEPRVIWFAMTKLISSLGQRLATAARPPAAPDPTSAA